MEVNEYGRKTDSVGHHMKRATCTLSRPVQINLLNSMLHKCSSQILVGIPVTRTNHQGITETFDGSSELVLVGRTTKKQIKQYCSIPDVSFPHFRPQYQHAYSPHCSPCICYGTTWEIWLNKTFCLCWSFPLFSWPFGFMLVQVVIRRNQIPTILVITVPPSRHKHTIPPKKKKCLKQTYTKSTKVTFTPQCFMLPYQKNRYVVL